MSTRKGGAWWHLHLNLQTYIYSLKVPSYKQSIIIVPGQGSPNKQA